MRQKGMYILLAVLLSVGILYYLSSESFREKRAEEKKLYPTFQEKEITRIEISKQAPAPAHAGVHQGQAQKVFLERKGDRWYLTDPLGYSTDPDAIKDLMEEIKIMEAEDVISRNSEKRKTFQVDDAGTWVKLFKEGKDPVISFVVGKISPDFSHTYVRKSDSNEVIRVKGLIKDTFERPVNQWRDKTIFEFDQEKPTRLELEYPEKKKLIQMEKKDGKWLFPGQKEVKVKEETVKEVLKNMASLKADDFSDKLEKDTGLNKPIFIVKAFLPYDKKEILLVGKNDEKGNYYVKKETSETTFLLTEEKAKALMKKEEDFKKQ